MPTIKQSASSRRKKKIIIEPIFTSSEVNNQTPNAASQEPQQAALRSNATIPETRLKSAQTSSKRPSIAGLGISITATTHIAEKDQAKEVKEEKTLSNLFSPLQLINEWKLYAESLTEEPHLRSTMLSCLPNLLSKDTFEVVVNNPVQEQRLTENGLGILSALRKNLQNTLINMQVRVSIENEKRQGFTAFEKFNLMMEENDALKKLKDEFGLELL